MSTRVYGTSDDLIELEGDLNGEVSHYGTGDEEYALGVLMAFSDGTILAVRYGNPAAGAVWAIDVLHKGELFDRLEICNDEEADPYSDQVFFKDGKLRAWSAPKAEKVK